MLKVYRVSFGLPSSMSTGTVQVTLLLVAVVIVRVIIHGCNGGKNIDGNARSNGNGNYCRV